jgi:hypothetical protein
LLYASGELRADHEIYVTAVQVNSALLYASKELRAGKVIEACSIMEMHCCMPRRSSVPTTISLDSRSGERQCIAVCFEGAPRRQGDQRHAAEWSCIAVCLGGAPCRPRYLCDSGGATHRHGVDAGGRAAGGVALLSASEVLRPDHGIALAAVQLNGDASQGGRGPALRRPRVRDDGRASGLMGIALCPEELRSDEVIAVAAVQQDVDAVRMLRGSSVPTS